jgi:4-amino-4-deoxy-L-arabinose transferase-like glycosyltransferase
MKLALVGIFCAALALLSVRAVHVRIADTFLDPVGKVDAQDEAMYASNAWNMARHGNWLTPVYQGRYGLYKPPLLAWLAGASAKVFGDSAFAVRLPVLLIATLTLVLLFCRAGWQPAADWKSARPAAAAAALLVLGNRLWFTLSTLCLTDSLLTAFITAGAVVLAADPRLESLRARWAFALATAAAIMVKSVAGIVPFLVLLAFCALAKRGEHPPARRIVWIVLVTAALVLPWGLYQLAIHPRWFWNEFVLSEVVTYGVSSPIQTTQENQVLFYLKRLFLIDPVLSLLSIAAIAVCGARIRACRLDTRVEARLLLAWLLVVFAGAFLWSYRNVTYLAPAIPALAILVALAIPPRIVIPIAAIALVAKLAIPAQPWSLELRPAILHPSVALLDDYTRQHRNRELILVDPFDGFYSSVLALPKVRYCFVSPTGVPPQGPLDLHYLGIVVTGEEFARLPQLEGTWRSRLRDWGLDSSEPIATSIVPKSREEATTLIATHPDTDFLLPESYRGIIAGHAPGESAGGFVLALATQKAKESATDEHR